MQTLKGNESSKIMKDITSMTTCLTCKKELESKNKEFCSIECARKFLAFKTE